MRPLLWRCARNKGRANKPAAIPMKYSFLAPACLAATLFVLHELAVEEKEYGAAFAHK